MIVAVVPAAGESRRMGRPKLPLPLGGRPLLARVVAALLAGGADRVVVVAPPAFRPESAEIVAIATDAGGEVVVPEAQPADMRASVELALGRVGRSPLLLAPGDSPAITAELVRTVVERHRRRPDRVVIPTENGRRGHPILIPADLALRIPELPPDAGINRLVASAADRVETVECGAAGLASDLDTPEDYLRWSNDPRFATGGDAPS